MEERGVEIHAFLTLEVERRGERLDDRDNGRETGDIATLQDVKEKTAGRMKGRIRRIQNVNEQHGVQRDSVASRQREGERRIHGRSHEFRSCLIYSSTFPYMPVAVPATRSTQLLASG